MNTYGEIKNIFEDYITSLEQRDMSNFKNLFSKKFTAEFSNIGRFQNSEILYKKLIFEYSINYQKNDICNFVLKFDNNKAVMSAYVMTLIGIDDGITFYPFQYGGKYVLEFIKEDKWKISKILFDLDWYKGNSCFVYGWHLIDYKTFAGHTPMIVSELDSPWAQIKLSQNVTDEIRIKETLFKYSFGLDNCDFALHKDSYTNDIKFYNNGKLVYANAHEILKDFKRLNHKEHALQHAIKVYDVRIQDNHAILYGLRIEPHRIGSKNINHETKDNSYFSAHYICYFLKHNNVWKMYEIHYDPKIIVKKEKRISHYVDEMKEL